MAFLQYPKTYRITTEHITYRGKLVLSHKEQCALLQGKVEVTEKMDGANVGIIRTKKGYLLQKRRGLADTGAHPQFAFFWNWASANNDRILKLPIGWIVYGELLYARHHITYDQLPSYFMAFNVWDGRKFLKKENCPFASVPTLYEGNELTLEMLESFLSEKSLYSSVDLREGVVIKHYKKQMMGKLVRMDFMKELDEEEEHWMMGPLARNKLAENVSVFA